MHTVREKRPKYDRKVMAVNKLFTMSLSFTWKEFNVALLYSWAYAEDSTKTSTIFYLRKTANILFSTFINVYFVYIPSSLECQGSIYYKHCLSGRFPPFSLYILSENQKGIITIQWCSVENQKGTIAIDFAQQWHHSGSEQNIVE